MTYIVGAFTTDTITAADRLTSGKAFGLGDRLTTHDGKEYVFVVATAALSAGFACFFDSAYNATMLSTANDARGNLVGVPEVAFATGEFGWLQVKGPGVVRVAASAVTNVRLNTTATAGQLDDDGTAGAMQVQGVYLTATNGGAAANVAAILNYPYIDVTL